MADVFRAAGRVLLGGIDVRLEEDLAGYVVVSTGGGIQSLVLLIEVHTAIDKCITLVCTYPGRLVSEIWSKKKVISIYLAS